MRIVNYIKPMRSTLCLAATAVAVCVSLQAQQPPILGSPEPAARGAKAFAGDRIFQTTKVHRLHLTISAAEWAVLQTSSQRGGGAVGGSDYRDSSGRLIHAGSGFVGYFPWVRSDVRIPDGTGAVSIKDAGLRYKGNLSFARSSAAAPLFANFKLKFDVHGTKGTWDGEKTFNLHAGVIDTSKMKDAIGFAVFRGAGVPASRTAFTEIIFTVPGVYNEVSGGTYTIIEDVNKKFLERVLPPGAGLMMKPEGNRGGVQYKGETWAQYAPTLRPDRDATPREQQRVMDFSKLCSQSDAATFRAQIDGYLDVDEFLRFIAVNALLVNSDSYIGGGHNFFFYLDSVDDKFRFLPWDLDLSMNNRGGLMGDVQILARPSVAGGGDPVGTVRFVGNTAVPTVTTVNGGGQMDLLRPYSGDHPLIRRVLEIPEYAELYKNILRELSEKAFTAGELIPMIDAMEKVGTGRGASPRAFIETRTAYLQQLVAGWQK